MEETDDGLEERRPEDGEGEGGARGGDDESIDSPSFLPSFLPAESVFWQRCSVLIPIKALLCPPSSKRKKGKREREHYDTLPWSASKEKAISLFAA